MLFMEPAIPNKYYLIKEVFAIFNDRIHFSDVSAVD